MRPQNQDLEESQGFGRDLWLAIRLTVLGWFLYIFAIPLVVGRWLGRACWSACEQFIRAALWVYWRMKSLFLRT